MCLQFDNEGCTTISYVIALATWFMLLHVKHFSCVQTFGELTVEVMFN